MSPTGCAYKTGALYRMPKLARVGWQLWRGFKLCGRRLHAGQTFKSPAKRTSSVLTSTTSIQRCAKFCGHVHGAPSPAPTRLSTLCSRSGLAVSCCRTLRVLTMAMITGMHNMYTVPSYPGGRCPAVGHARHTYAAVRARSWNAPPRTRRAQTQVW